MLRLEAQWGITDHDVANDPITLSSVNDTMCLSLHYSHLSAGVNRGAPCMGENSTRINPTALWHSGYRLAEVKCMELTIRSSLSPSNDTWWEYRGRKETAVLAPLEYSVWRAVR